MGPRHESPHPASAEEALSFEAPRAPDPQPTPSGPGERARPKPFGRNRHAAKRSVQGPARRRAAVTGLGIISPLGHGTEAFWQALNEARTGLGPITFFDAATFPSRIAAEVKDFPADEYLDARQRRYYSRASQFACVAAKMGLADARIESIDPFRTDVILGSAVSAFDVLEEQFYRSPSHCAEYDGSIEPTSLARFFMNAPATAVALQHGVRGYVTTVSSACASVLNAVGLASERIQDGRCDLALCGGVDTPITRFLLNSFCSAKMLTTVEDPADALCPFDERHTRPALGEGAAVFCIEDLEAARARGARIYAEVTNFALQTENVNELYMPDASGEAWAATLRKVLGRFRSIDLLNAHGPSDRALDRLEARAFKQALGEVRARRVPVTSIKGAVGSGFASAGAFQVAAAALSLHTGRIPPIYNLRRQDPECDLRFVQERSWRRRLRRALVSGRALGGANSALLLERAWGA